MGNIEPMKEAQSVIEAVEKSVPKNLMFDSESTFIPETKPITSSGARGLTVEEAKRLCQVKCVSLFIPTLILA